MNGTFDWVRLEVGCVGIVLLYDAHGRAWYGRAKLCAYRSCSKGQAKNGRSGLGVAQAQYSEGSLKNGKITIPVG